MTTFGTRAPLGRMEARVPRPGEARAAGKPKDLDELAANHAAGAERVPVLMPGAPHLRVVTASEGAGPDSTVAGSLEATDLDGLYRRYAPYVAAVAMRILGRDHELDDLVQDAFLNALRGLRDLREPAAIKGWLARITVRLAVRRLRQRRLRRMLQLERDVLDYESLAAPAATPEQRALIGRIYRVLDQLPVADRVVWVLRHVQGEQLQRIPELCGCSLSTAQRRLRRAQAAVERGLLYE